VRLQRINFMKSYYILLEISNYKGIENKPYQLYNYFSRFGSIQNKKFEFYNALPTANEVLKFKAKKEADKFKTENNLSHLKVMKIEIY
jgi:hypothetical protein